METSSDFARRLVKAIRRCGQPWRGSAARLPIPSLRPRYGSVWPVKGIGDPWGYAEPSLKRLHRRLFRLNEKIAKLEQETRQVSAELEYHRSIDDDAQRDAVVGNYIDRQEAGLTAADVRRFEKTLSDLNVKRDTLAAKRDYLLARLPD